MAQPQTIENNVAKIGHNGATPDFIVESAKQMAEIDSTRKTLNKKASDIRAAIKDRGEDTDAFKEVYGYFKKKRHEREGFDESYKRQWDALNAADTGDMFSFQDDGE